MEEVIEKRRITPVLMGMDVGDKEIFPIEQYECTVTTVQRLQTRHARTGRRWQINKQSKDLTVLITRTA